MNFLLVLLFVFLAIYSCISWLLPNLLAWLFKRKYHINLKIGRIGVLKLILKDVSLSKDRYSIHINEVSFKSSFFNSDINKLVWVVIRGLEVTNNLEEKRSVVVETILKPLLSKQNSATKNVAGEDDSPWFNALNRQLSTIAHRKVLDFRDKKLPPSLIMFAQFMGVHIFDVSVNIQNGSLDSGWCLRASASEIHADGAGGGPARALVFSANVAHAQARVVKGVKCLAEVLCSLLVEGTVKAEGPLNVEKIDASLSDWSATLQDDLYDFVQKHKKYRRPSVVSQIDEDDHLDTFVPRWSPVIPKIFSLKIDPTTVTCFDNVTNTTFEVSLQSVQVNSRFSAASVLTNSNGSGSSALPQLYVALQVDNLKLLAAREEMLFLNKLKLDAKLEKGVLNLYLILSTCNITYDHSKTLSWYNAAVDRTKRYKALQVNTSNGDAYENSDIDWEGTKDHSRRFSYDYVIALCVAFKIPKFKTVGALTGVPAWVSRVLRAVVVQGCGELRAACARARLPAAAHLAAGCAGLKLRLDQMLDTREQGYQSSLAGLVVGRRHWSTELLLEAGWAGRPPPPQHQRRHAPATNLLNVALLKCGSHGRTHTKVEAMLDCLRLEWSENIAKTIISLIDCLHQYRSTTAATPETPPDDAPLNITVNVALSHINLFLIVTDDICLMTRIDAVTLEKTRSKSAAVVSGVKVVDIMPYKNNVECQRSEEIPSSFFYLRLARVEHVPSKERNSTLIDVQFIESVDFHWSANIYLKIVHFIRAVKAFSAEVKARRDRDGVSVAKKKKGREIDWRVGFQKETTLELLLSEENTVSFVTDNMSIFYDHITGLSILWRQLKMVINGDDIVTIEGYHQTRVTDDADVRVERKANEGFALVWNNIWSVDVESVRVVFPYRHQFAAAVQGDLVSHFKWLKAVHHIQKKPFTADSPLPSDLHIKIEEILVEMSDDPFEVKLRDNYELLEDEYKESQKRRDMLDAKVQELSKTHLFLPVEELYAALRQKDAQIYVQRSLAAPPPRSRLVACCMTEVRCIALADPALHGAHNVLQLMRTIDHDSPWSEECGGHSTLWARGVAARCGCWQLLLRDFPQPLLSMRRLRCWGTLLAAEQAPHTRALRTVKIKQGAPWGDFELERSMMPLKWYYDLCCEMSQYSYAFGPCWEPVIAQCNLAFDQVSRPSLDPSPPLAWWDKVRLLMHGRLTVKVNKFTCLLHVSLDPYNTTEEMELTWNDLVLDWTNGKIAFLGELNILVRTASKYDDCRVVVVPGLRLVARLAWCCAAEPRDHRAVHPTAPDKLPEYSSNQEHDSYRAFRSQGLDLHLTLETKASETNGPILLLYGSTLRWFESLKLILSGITRPTRRGLVFNNVRTRKPQLSRHYKNVSVSLTLHNLEVFYWSSSSMQRGIEMLCSRVTLGSKHHLSLVPTNDGLVRRPRANWTTVYMNCDLNDAEIWLKNATTLPEDKDADPEHRALPACRMEKCYCVSVRRVSYGREAGGGAPTHRLAVHDLRGAWTKLNRDLAFALIDTYIKTQQLKKNLSTKALKEEEDPVTSPTHSREEVASPPPNNAQGGGGGEGGMLAALVAAAGGDALVVFSDELSGDAAPPHRHPAHDDDSHTAVLIELVNSQVVLRGCARGGYVVVCAARAEVRQRVRRRGAGTAWAAALSAMQYYATVSAPAHAHSDHLPENIQWVSVEEIEERWVGAEMGGVLLGGGHSPRGVLGPAAAPHQLQRIVSRCACEFYYVSREEEGGGGARGGGREPYDAFTLMHHDLDVCTNSLQYAMLLDVINNVVLHVEPERRRTLELRARMRFQLQLHQDQDPRQLIHKLQTQVRESLARLRRLEKEYYLKHRSLDENDPVAIAELKSLDDQVNECKEVVWSLGEELDAMIRAWLEARRGRAGEPRPAPHRHNEICFKSARWRLTDADGQLGIADLLLTNFLYTKMSRSDDTVEHQLEVGYVSVKNLLPNEPFPEVLVPQEPSGRAPVARRAALRVFCRDRPPVGGIAVKEHFEVNVVPIRIGLTKKFFNTMLKFCFPERDPDAIEDGEDDDVQKSGPSGGLVHTASKKVKKKKDSNSNFYVKRDNKNKDDVEKMKERAEKNKLFIYIKIPEVPVRVSYKGSKEKNLEDVRDLPLVLPTLEYHNVTWTWLDLLLATKSDTRRVIVSQAIRQKLQLHRRAAAAPEPLEEDKARLLLGDRTVTEQKPHKKSTPSVFKFSKS